jgi:hypothetical protein
MPMWFSAGTVGGLSLFGTFSWRKALLGQGGFTSTDLRCSIIPAKRWL